MDIDLSASIAINNKNNIWIPDNMVIKCFTCGVYFNVFLRKHHCRNCGNIFCYKCCENYIIIPRFINDRPNPEDYWNLSHYIKILKSEKEKVCNKCYNEINEKIKLYQKIIDMYISPLNLNDIINLSDTNLELKNNYINHLRNIQYYLPNHVYSDIDKKFLKINSNLFSKHSKYLVHLIKSIEWENNNLNDLKNTIDIINGDKIKKCNELYCTRTCNEQLSCDDCINILYSTSSILPDILINYLFDIIEKSSEIVILCHLSVFINIIKKNSKRSIINENIFKLINKNEKLIYQSFWLLNNSLQESNIIEIKNIKNFINLFNPVLLKTMRKEYFFYTELIKNLENPNKFLSSEFNNYKPISLPYEPSIKIIDYDPNSIIIKSSYTKPTIITFIVEDIFNNEIIKKKINLLFKKESIFNDYIVLNLMILTDIILKDYFKDNFIIVTYSLMPLSNNSGIIQIIDDANTIYEIVNKNKKILDHILENNEDKIIGDVLDNYMYSLVSYTLHSYFIGLGDRHLQNIMIKKDGTIFHIDFGFILGKDAYPITGTNIKLNSGMLNVIINNKRYEKYLSCCSEGVIILRKYFNIFFILLSQISKFDIQYIESFILSRFQPRQHDEYVINELMSIIIQSQNAYSDKIKDFFHYHTQEKTIQNGILKILNNAYNTVKNYNN